MPCEGREADTLDGVRDARIGLVCAACRRVQAAAARWRRPAPKASGWAPGTRRRNAARPGRPVRNSPRHHNSRPSDGSIRLAISLSSVLLPQPEGPIRVRNSPSAIAEIDRRQGARCRWRRSFSADSISTAGGRSPAAVALGPDRWAWSVQDRLWHGSAGSAFMPALGSCAYPILRSLTKRTIDRPSANPSLDPAGRRRPGNRRSASQRCGGDDPDAQAGGVAAVDRLGLLQLLDGEGDLRRRSSSGLSALISALPGAGFLM